MAVRETQKQPVLASQGVVTANHPLASTAGINMLAAGGSVADAAIATIFASAVVEPQMVGCLGAGYIMHRDASGAVTVIDHYAEAPATATDTTQHSKPDFAPLLPSMGSMTSVASGFPNFRSPASSV